jgi:hypothetical protein
VAAINPITEDLYIQKILPPGPVKHHTANSSNIQIPTYDNSFKNQTIYQQNSTKQWAQPIVNNLAHRKSVQRTLISQEKMNIELTNESSQTRLKILEDRSYHS